MGMRERRRAAARAERRLHLESRRWQADTSALREHFAHHRVPWLLGGGFGAGMVASLLPLRAGARFGRLITSVATLLLRSPLGGLLIESARRRFGATDGNRVDASAEPHADR